MSFVDEMKSTPRKIEIPMEYICNCVDTMLDEAAKVFIEHIKSKIREIVKTENLRRIERTELTSGGEIVLGDFAFSNKYNPHGVRDNWFDIVIEKWVDIPNYDENLEYKLPNLGYMSNYGNMLSCHDNMCLFKFYDSDYDIKVLYNGGEILKIGIWLRYPLETTETGFIFKKKSTQCVPNELLKRFSSKVSQLALQDGITSEFIHTYDDYYGLRVRHHYIFQY